jgi:serine phosphatase RsbU (regulator of sigma subunit)
MMRYSRDGTYLDILPAKDFNPLLPPDQLLGKNVSDVLPPALARQLIQAIQQTLQTQETQLLEYQLPSDNGLRDFESRLVVSGPDEVLALVRNVTTRKQAEQEHLRLTSIQQELKIAQDIQQSLLPSPKPDWSSLEVICYSAPAREIGGDFYTYQELAGNLLVEGKPVLKSFALAIGDVTGKGLPAALLMAVSLASLQAVIDQSFPPSQLLAHLDQAIARYTEAARQNCALVYIEIDVGSPERGPCLRVSNAGGISPLIRRTDGSVVWVEIGGLPLGAGLEETSGYPEMTMKLAPGELVILTSDGVVEAMNNIGQMFGFKRLEQAVTCGPATSAAAMLAHLQAEVAAFVGDIEPHDDLTIVVARV